MANLPDPIQKAIDALSNLPGIGSRSAERLTFALLKNPEHISKNLANALLDLEKIKECEISHNYTEQENCPIVLDSRRNSKIICVVESPMDVIALERTHEYKGQYHVLHGVISPLNKIRPEDIRIASLIQRIQKNPEIEEIIFALSCNIESDTTTFYIIEKLNTFFDGKITQIARGIPSGGDLDYLDIGTISRAFLDRKNF